MPTNKNVGENRTPLRVSLGKGISPQAEHFWGEGKKKTLVGAGKKSTANGPRLAAQGKKGGLFVSKSQKKGDARVPQA